MERDDVVNGHRLGITKFQYITKREVREQPHGAHPHPAREDQREDRVCTLLAPNVHEMLLIALLNDPRLHRVIARIAHGAVRDEAEALL